MILCLGTTPAAQRVMVFHRLTLDAVNRAVTTLDGAAGKSVNVAKTLKALGEQPVAVGFLGGDRGAEVRALLAAQNIAADFVNVSARTRQCTTLLDQAAGTITELVEEGQPVSTADYAALLDLSLIHISEPTRLLSISYAVFCLKKKQSNPITPSTPTNSQFQRVIPPYPTQHTTNSTDNPLVLYTTYISTYLRTYV